MTSIGDRGLICLDDGDYAALPLMFQNNRGVINAALTSQATLLAGYANATIYRLVLSSNQTGLGANSGITFPDGTACTQILSMSSFSNPFKKGWWEMNTSMSFQEAGAVTNPSYRRTVAWAYITSQQTSDSRFLYEQIQVDTNTASQDCGNVTGWFYSDGVNQMTVSCLFGHGNLASNMTVFAGAVLNVRFLGSGLPL